MGRRVDPDSALHYRSSCKYGYNYSSASEAFGGGAGREKMGTTSQLWCETTLCEKGKWEPGFLFEPHGTISVAGTARRICLSTSIQAWPLTYSMSSSSSSCHPRESAPLYNLFLYNCPGNSGMLYTTSVWAQKFLVVPPSYCQHINRAFTICRELYQCTCTVFIPPSGSRQQACVFPLFMLTTALWQRLDAGLMLSCMAIQHGPWQPGWEFSNDTWCHCVGTLKILLCYRGL